MENVLGKYVRAANNEPSNYCVYNRITIYSDSTWSLIYKFSSDQCPPRFLQQKSHRTHKLCSCKLEI